MDWDSHGGSPSPKMGTQSDSFFSSSCDAVARALGGNGQSLSEKNKIFYCSPMMRLWISVAFKSSLRVLTTFPSNSIVIIIINCRNVLEINRHCSEIDRLLKWFWWRPRLFQVGSLIDTTGEKKFRSATASLFFPPPLIYIHARGFHDGQKEAWCSGEGRG